MNPERKLLRRMLGIPGFRQNPPGGLRSVGLIWSVVSDLDDPVPARDRTWTALTGDHGQPGSASARRHIGAERIPLRAIGFEFVDRVGESLIDASFIHGLAVDDPYVLAGTPAVGAARWKARRLVLVVGGLRRAYRRAA